jgi:hypothetical protein
MSIMLDLFSEREKYFISQRTLDALMVLKSIDSKPAWQFIGL